MRHIERLKSACGGATAGPWVKRDLAMQGQSILQLGDAPSLDERSIQLGTAEVALITLLCNCRDELVAVVEAASAQVAVDDIPDGEWREAQCSGCGEAIAWDSSPDPRCEVCQVRDTRSALSALAAKIGAQRD